MPSNRIIDIKRTNVDSPATEPLTLQQIKDHLIINSTDDDLLLARLNIQCREAVEEFCAVSMVRKQITLTADLFREWELPYGPLIGIQSVATRVGDPGSGPPTYQTAVTGWSQEGEEFVSFDPGENPVWDWGPPLPRFWAGEGWNNRYKIVYTAGYNPVPEGLKLAILNEIAYRYERRGNEDISGLCEAAQILALPYQRKLWF